jgi:hypothetical protein
MLHVTSFSPPPEIVERWRKHVAAADEQAAATRQVRICVVQSHPVFVLVLALTQVCV